MHVMCMVADPWSEIKSSADFGRGTLLKGLSKRVKSRTFRELIFRCG